MKTIWKFQILFLIKGNLTMPEKAKIVSVQMQGEIPTLWAEVDTDAPVEKRQFVFYGTGHRQDEGCYIGTFQSPPFVWHLYEVIRSSQAR